MQAGSSEDGDSYARDGAHEKKSDAGDDLPQGGPPRGLPGVSRIAILTG